MSSGNRSLTNMLEHQLRLCTRCRAVDLSRTTQSSDRLLLTLTWDTRSKTCTFCSQFNHLLEQDSNNRVELRLHIKPVENADDRKGDSGSYFTLRSITTPYELFILPGLQKVSATSDERILDVKHWLDTCELRHSSACQQTQLPRKHSITLRVIDCTTRQICLAPIEARYACLSYVWGTSDGHVPVQTESLKKIAQDRGGRDSCYQSARHPLSMG